MQEQSRMNNSQSTTSDSHTHTCLSVTVGIVVVIVLAVVGFVGYAAYYNAYLRTTTQVLSVSPDGHYHCRVTETTPEYTYASPYVYSFTIGDHRTGQSLPGKPYQLNHDSCALPLDQLKCEWKSTQLTIKEPCVSQDGQNECVIATANMDDNGQQWQAK